MKPNNLPRPKRYALKLKHLHPIHGKNRWCGPGAISLLTGMSTDEASRLARSFTGSTKCTYMHHSTMIKCLEACNLSPNLFDRQGHLPMKKRQTINQWRKAFKNDLKLKEQGYDIFLVSAGGHFQILQGDFFVDNIVKEPLLFDDMKKGKGRKIRKVWKIYYMHGNDLTIPDVAKDTPQKRNSIKGKVKRLAKKMNVDLDIQTWDDCPSEPTIWMYASDEDISKHGDPWDDDHSVYSYQECYDRLDAEWARRVVKFKVQY